MGMKPPSKKVLKRLIDDRIARAYYASCRGVHIDIMDIGKVFNAGREAITQGADDEALGKHIRAYVETIRQN